MDDRSVAIPVIVGFVVFFLMFSTQAYGETYNDEVNGFSMEYPTGWDIENEFVSQDGIDYVVTFYDDIDRWLSMLDVRHIPNYSMVPVGTDQQWLNGLNMGLSQECESSTLEVYGYICSNHKLIDSRVVYIDEKKSYQLTYSWTETLEDNSQYENISISTSIPDGYDLWTIYSESASDVYNSHKRPILTSIDSFDILKSIIETSQISEYQREDKIFFEDDISAYVDFSIRPMSLVTPKEFTPEWYVNSKHEFAIKFPNSWKEDWILNESFSGNKIAEFSSKETDGKMEFFIEDSDLFQKFNGFDKDRLYQETELMATESINRFHGFFQVDALSVVKFSDGFVTGATFFQINENGDTNLYDVTYLIFENGKVVEVLHYGDNFSTINFNDYALMFESGYIGNTSIIPVVTESKPKSEIFVNDDLGFSFIPPKGWKESEFNTQVGMDRTSLTLNVITSFSSPNFQGILGSDMIVMYMDLEQPIELEQEDEEAFMKELTDGFMKGLDQSGQGKITNSNLERFENSIKTNLEGIIKIDLDGIYIERQIQADIWIFENGEAYYLMFVADPVDYDNFVSEFRTSADTVTFKPKPQTKTQTIQEENGGGCLIATATYGSELAPQVQQLRELRDNKLLQTESGSAFMESFNDFYYSFSPIIGDYERENPIFKEAVKLAITPMISSLSILNYVDMDSEAEVLGYGISLILLNIGMYFVSPAAIVWQVKKRI